MKPFIQRPIALLLTASLLVTSVPGLDAAIFSSPSPYKGYKAFRYFQMNQEKMRLETEALTLQYLGSKPLLENRNEEKRRPFWSRLLVSTKNQIPPPETLTDEQKAQVERAEARIRSAFPSSRAIYASTILFALGMLTAQTMGFTLDPEGMLFACGNFIMFGHEALLRLLARMKDPTLDLVNRGVLSIGGYFQVQETMTVPKDRQIPGFEIGSKDIKVWNYVGVKELILKRDSPVELLFKTLSQQAHKAQNKAGQDRPLSPASVELHSRFATTGSDNDTVDELTQAAQPGIAPGHWELRWDYAPNGKLEPRYIWVEHHYQFNGDLNATRRLQLKMSADEVVGNQAARDRMLRWLGLKEVPPGDAPLEALYQDMFYAERLWYTAIRYAMFAHVSRPGDVWDLNPPIQQMRSWEVLFHHAFRVFMEDHPEMSWDPPADAGSDLEAARMAEKQMIQAAAFSQYLKDIFLGSARQRIEFMERSGEQVTSEVLDDLRHSLGDDELDRFLDTSTRAFFRNTLEYVAIREIKPRVEGTFGGTHLSTLNPPGSRVMNVTTSFGQGIVVGLNKNGNLASITSDRIIQQQLSDEDAQDMLVLDDSGNETLVAGMDKTGRTRITLYRGPDSIVVPIDELRRRIRPLKDLQDPEVYVQAKGLPTLGRMESGLRTSAIQLDLVHQQWENVQHGIKSRNLQAGSEIIRMSIQQRIYEYIRKRIGVNERNLPARLDEELWQEADRLSRGSWDRTLTEPQIADEAEVVARRAEAALIQAAPLRIGPQAVQDLLGGIPKKIQAALRVKVDGAEQQEGVLRTLTTQLMGALQLGANGRRLEEAHYDVILLGTESSLLALEKFGKYVLRPMLGLRAKVVVGNDFLEKANQYSKDPDGFLHAMQINSMRTLVIQASDSAETFEAGVDSAWAVATVRELFTVTGSKNNRLVDRVNTFRSMTTHNPGSKTYDNLKSYIAMLQTFNEFALYWGKSVTSRFDTGGKGWKKKPFFQTPFQRSDFEILDRSNERFVNDVAPVILGYHASGHEIRGAANDRAKLEQLGRHTGARQLEPVRRWILEKVYLVLVSPIVGLAINYLLTKFPVLGITPGIGSYLVSVALGFSVSLSLLLGMRFTRKYLRLPVPKLLAGFGPPIFVFADAYRYVHHFLMLYATTGTGKAYGINSAPFFNSSVNNLIDDFKARATRRAVIMIGRSGAPHKALRTADGAAEMAGRQLKSLVNLPFRTLKYLGVRPVGPEVIFLGHYKPSPDRWWRMSRDIDVDFASHNVLWMPPGQDLATMPDHLVRYYEDNYGGFGRLLGGVRALATHINMVSRHLPRFAPAEYQGGYRVKSTAGPVPGVDVLDEVQNMPPTLRPVIPEDGEPTHRSDNPLVIDEHPVLAFWSSDLPLHNTNGHSHRRQPPSRPATRQPGGRTGMPLPVAVPAPLRTPEKAPRPLTALIEQFLEDNDAEIETSLLIKNSNGAAPSAPRTTVGTVEFKYDGAVLQTEGHVSPSLLQLLDKAVHRMALFSAPVAELSEQQGLYLSIRDIPERAAFYLQMPAKNGSRAADLIVLDAPLVAAAEANKAGAQTAAYLELAEELLHGIFVKQQTVAARSQKGNAKPPSRRNLELATTALKVRLFLGEPAAERMKVIRFWERHPQYDPMEYGFAKTVLRPAHKAMQDAKRKKMSDEDALEFALNQEHVIKAAREYVDRALQVPSSFRNGNGHAVPAPAAEPAVVASPHVVAKVSLSRKPSANRKPPKTVTEAQWEAFLKTAGMLVATTPCKGCTLRMVNGDSPLAYYHHEQKAFDVNVRAFEPGPAAEPLLILALGSERFRRIQLLHDGFSSPEDAEAQVRAEQMRRFMEIPVAVQDPIIAILSNSRHATDQTMAKSFQASRPPRVHRAVPSAPVASVVAPPAVPIPVVTPARPEASRSSWAYRLGRAAGWMTRHTPRVARPKPSVRQLLYGSVAAAVLLGAVWLGYQYFFGAVPMPPLPAHELAFNLSTNVPAITPPDMGTIITEGAKTAVDHVLKIKPGDTLGEIAQRLQRDPQLKGVLPDHLWGTDGAVARVWDVIGPYTRSGHKRWIHIGETFNISTLYPAVSATPTVIPPQASALIEPIKNTPVMQAAMGFGGPVVVQLFSLIVVGFAAGMQRIRADKSRRSAAHWVARAA